MEFKKVILCDKCPCFNSDYEQDSSCNLDYVTDFFWIKGGKRIIASTNCKLISINYGKNQDIFVPEFVLARKKKTEYEPEAN